MADMNGVSHNGLRRIYRVLCHLAWCDGDVAPTEREFLETFRAEYKIRDDEAATLEEEGKESKGLGVGKRAEERALMLDVMIDITMIDGLLATEEQERLAKFAVTFGLTPEELAARIVERAREKGKRMESTQQKPQA